MNIQNNQSEHITESWHPMGTNMDPIIRHALTQSVLNFQLHAFVNNSSREFIEENLFEKGPVHLWAPINSGKIKIRVKHNFLSYNIY